MNFSFEQELLQVDSGNQWAGKAGGRVGGGRSVQIGGNSSGIILFLY